MEKIRLQKIVLYFYWLSLVRPDAFVYFRNIWNARMNLFKGKKIGPLYFYGIEEQNTTMKWFTD